MSDAPSKSPAPLPESMRDMLAVYRDGDRLDDDARDRIWHEVSAPRPPKRRFAPLPTTGGGRARRWMWVAGVAAAAVLVGVVGLRVQEARRAERARADAAAEMSEAERGASGDASAADGRAPLRAPGSVPSHAASPPAHAPSQREPQAPPTPAPTSPSDNAETTPAVPQGAAGDDGETNTDASAGKRRRPRATPPPPAPAAEPTPDPAATILDEQRVLARAWSALTSGQRERALDIAAQHAERHPDGILGPEREAVRAIARCSLRPDTSAKILSVYEASHAGSPLAARVRKACGGG